MSAIACTGCGSPAGDSAENPAPNHCNSCPPEFCESCGGVNHIATNRMCSCWVSVDDIPFADLKSAFAEAGLGVDTDGRVRT